MRRRRAVVWAGWVVGTLALAGCGSELTSVVGPSEESVSKPGVSTSMVMGPAGGMMTAGPYTLHVPAGALLTSQTLTLEQENNGKWPVSLGPEGTQFVVPVFLAFDASGESNAAAMDVAWWNPTTNGWVDQVTYHNGQSVGAMLSHFSRYIIH